MSKLQQSQMFGDLYLDDLLKSKSWKQQIGLVYSSRDKLTSSMMPFVRGDTGEKQS